MGAAAELEFTSWQSDCSDLSNRLGTLREKKLWTDCEILVGPSKVRVPAHRVLLGAASPVLARMLYGPCGTAPELPPELPTVIPDTFNRVLEYIYTDDIEIYNIEIACSLYEAAHYLILPQLEAVCKSYLLEYVSADSVFQVYEFAKLYGEKEITDQCLKVMRTDTETVLSGEGLEKASAETLECLFKLKELDIPSELELFLAAERWVRARSLKTQHQGQGESSKQTMGHGNPDCEEDSGRGSGDGGDSEPKWLIRDALKQIRFLTMSHEEFSRHDMTSLLSKADVLAIALNLLSDHTYSSMPKGFSTSKNRRCNGETYSIQRFICDEDEEKDVEKAHTFYDSEDWEWTLDLERCGNMPIIRINPVDNSDELHLCGISKFVRVKILNYQDDGKDIKLPTACCAFGREFTGEIVFKPPLTWQELNNSYNGWKDDEGNLTLEVNMSVSDPRRQHRRVMPTIN